MLTAELFFTHVAIARNAMIKVHQSVIGMQLNESNYVCWREVAFNYNVCRAFSVIAFISNTGYSI